MQSGCIYLLVYFVISFSENGGTPNNDLWIKIYPAYYCIFIIGNDRENSLFLSQPGLLPKSLYLGEMFGLRTMVDTLWPGCIVARFFVIEVYVSLLSNGSSVECQLVDGLLILVELMGLDKPEEVW